MSNLLREKFRFGACVQVREERSRLEARLVATITACHMCGPSEEWLGRLCYGESPEIVGCGIGAIPPRNLTRRTARSSGGAQLVGRRWRQDDDVWRVHEQDPGSQADLDGKLDRPRGLCQSLIFDR